MVYKNYASMLQLPGKVLQNKALSWPEFINT